MTNRLAILIEAWQIAGHVDVPGAKVDVDNYEMFLKSDFGGAWNDDEIITLHTPTADRLAMCVMAAGLCDYAFITFSGHGYHLRDRGYEESRIYLNDREVVPVATLDPQNDRCQIISDSCREITTLDELEKQAKGFRMALSEAEERLKPNRRRCRDLFDSHLARAAAGTTRMYSCSIDEVADESQIRGGYFSRGLIDTAETWAKQREAGVLDTDLAFTGAYAITKSKRPTQTPVHEANRRRNYFPFSVLAY